VRGRIQSLRVGKFDLGGQPPSVRLLAAYSKRRREDMLPLRREMARALAEFFRGRLPSAVAFGILENWRSAEMLVADLKLANVKATDAEGRALDFHGLRHTFISNVARGGVAPKVAQALARHSSIELTLGRYTHIRGDDTTRALDALPDLTREPAVDVPSDEAPRESET
jgi:integrase